MKTTLTDLQDYVKEISRRYGNRDVYRYIEDGDVVTVRKSPSDMKLIRIKKNNFYSVMRSKMTEI